MSDAAKHVMPERIWANTPGHGGCVISFRTPSMDYNTEYVRADLLAEMLHTLKALRDECSGTPRPWVLVDILTDATEAIAKAEGRQP